MKLSICALSFLTFALYANDNSIIASLNEDMDQTTQLATETNHNIDYQPFILSIFQSDDLMRFGVKTLGEALPLVPGVDIATNTMNYRTPIFRGSNPTAYGQSTLIIDGVVLNDTFSSNYNAYLDFPIELIERIEVVRGTGSFIEGINSYAGTINVITRANARSLSAQKGALFGYAGSSNSFGGGGWSRYSGEDWNFSLDAFTQKHNQRTPIEVKDGYDPLISPSDYAQLGMEHTGVGATFSYKNLNIQGRINQYKSDSAFGNLNALPNPDGELQQPSWYLQGKYTLALNSDSNIVFKTLVMEDSWESDARAYPEGYSIFTDGYWASLMVKFRRISGGATLHYNGFDSHRITAGIDSSWNKSVDMKTIGNKIPALGIQDYTNTNPFIYADQAKRQSTDLYLSDTINVNDHVALALTLGKVQTSDIQSHTYNRAALLYQPDRIDIFKLMLACGVRLPSAQEMYVTPSPYAAGNPNLTHEHVRSIEGQYLRKLSSNLTAGINLFYLENTNQIVRDSTATFQNMGENIIEGGEVELRGKISPEETIALSYSYIHGTVTDQETGSKSALPYAASHLIKASYSYDFLNNWTLGGVWNYVGSKKRYMNDTRDNLASYNTLDLALGWQMNESKGWYGQVVVKNIGDTVVRYPAPASTYSDDYPVADRSFLIRTGWKF
jgi:iron complex outermembrane receptor protein